MIIEDRIIRDYLQAANNRGGGYAMAMSMMASRLVVLEDRLSRAGVSVDPDRTIAKLVRGEI